MFASEVEFFAGRWYSLGTYSSVSLSHLSSGFGRGFVPASFPPSAFMARGETVREQGSLASGFSPAALGAPLASAVCCQVVRCTLERRHSVDLPNENPRVLIERLLQETRAANRDLAKFSSVAGLLAENEPVGELVMLSLMDDELVKSDLWGSAEDDRRVAGKNRENLRPPSSEKGFRRRMAAPISRRSPRGTGPGWKSSRNWRKRGSPVRCGVPRSF